MFLRFLYFQRKLNSFFRTERLTNIHLELTTRCKVACRRCDRTFVTSSRNFKVSHPHHYQGPAVNPKDHFGKKHDMPLGTVKKLVPPQSKFKVFISGNFGDPLYHPQIIDILQYLLYQTKVKHINLTTNGSSMPEEFWQTFVEKVFKDKKITDKKLHLTFSIDGLEDTNKIYRVGSNWQSILAGLGYLKGTARMSWKFIVFSHNQHQIEEAQKVYRDLGFESISFIQSNRYNWFWCENDTGIEINKETFKKTGDPLEPCIDLGSVIHGTGKPI